MKKKIAVAVDGSISCNYSVRYAVSLLSHIADLGCTLIHVQPQLSQYLTAEAERKPKAYQALKSIMQAHQEESARLLQKVRDQMIRLGVAGERINICSLIRNNSVAEGLLDECRLKSYDAICVGRRGLSYLQEMVMGSVTNLLFEHSQVTPVWMVDGEVPNAKILLAADGSPNALRALDHLCFMLGGDPDTKIHMVHVKPRLQEYCEINIADDALAAAEEVVLDSHQRCLDDFYPQALKVLEKNGFDPDRLTVQIIANRFSTAGAILDAAKEGGFGTVVVGRRGFKKSFFTGGVLRKIIQKSKDIAVWVVP